MNTSMLEVTLGIANELQGRVDRLEAINAELLEALIFMVGNCGECGGSGRAYDSFETDIIGACQICQGARKCITVAEGES